MRRGTTGYTLLEMMVALVVFGLVMAGIAQAFRFGLSAWPAAARNAARPEAMTALDTALTDMIVQARPGSMTGKADRLAFTTRLPAGAGLNGGLADVGIFLAAPGGTLVLRYAAHPPGIPLGGPAVPQTELLAQGVTGFAATYLEPRRGTAPAWTGTWQGSGLPLLVRLHLDFADHHEWPDLVAAPAGTGG